jgi:vancomycin resistance protein YoaR
MYSSSFALDVLATKGARECFTDGPGAANPPGVTEDRPPRTPEWPGMRRPSPRKAVALMIPLVIVAAAVLTWVVDTRIHADLVARNVVLDGRAIGGFGQEDIDARVRHLSSTYLDTPVEIHSGDRTLETTVGELGAEVDQEATIAAAQDIDQDPVSWAQRFREDDVAPVILTLADNPVSRTLQELEGSDRTSPIEPLIQHSGFGFAVVPGVPGHGIRATEVIDQVVAGAVTGEDPIVVDVDAKDIPPRFDDSEAEALAEEANTLTENGITINADGTSPDVTAQTLGPWVTSRPGREALKLVLDREQVGEDLPGLLPDVGDPPAAASFTVTNGLPRIVPGQPGTGCCAPGSARRVIAALRNGDRSVDLELTRIRPERDAEWAESLGIVEEISLPDQEPCTAYAAEGCRMSTHHDCCESRVTNIHRMADIVRGYVIPPNGGHFSINEVVGPRTTENGFVVAGAIENGEHVESVGGGVSQFATTSFNAAFFAGLDIPNYQFHTEHLSRYPYGRESTVSYPAPEFRIVNNTPYGVLMWPTYDDTTITMHLYSTRFATGAQTGQSTGTNGSCTTVNTTRTRTYVDGHTENDTFSGYYRNGGTHC